MNWLTCWWSGGWNTAWRWCLGAVQDLDRLLHTWIWSLLVQVLATHWTWWTELLLVLWALHSWWWLLWIVVWESLWWWRKLLALRREVLWVTETWVLGSWMLLELHWRKLTLLVMVRESWWRSSHWWLTLSLASLSAHHHGLCLLKRHNLATSWAHVLCWRSLDNSSRLRWSASPQVIVCAKVVQRREISVLLISTSRRLLLLLLWLLELLLPLL